MKKKAKVYTVLLVVIGLTVCINASQCASSNITSARVLLNAPIDFSFPHLGNVGSCNLQTHTNGWTRENIDRWEFAPCDNFSNGVASVVVNGQTNTWTVLAPDRPLFRFGRYYCGFVREDRPDKTHAIYAGLFFGGVMVGAEHMREDFDWRTHTWHELDNIPDGIRQIGGERQQKRIFTTNGIRFRRLSIQLTRFQARQIQILLIECLPFIISKISFGK